MAAYQSVGQLWLRFLQVEGLTWSVQGFVRYCLYLLDAGRSYALANQGHRVFLMGCDPMGDSTHNLLHGYTKPILDVLMEHDFEYEDIEVAEIVHQSPLPFENGGSVYCAEAGGPEPGVGCGGKGVIEAINTLQRLEVFDELEPDLVIYDILGDVVCGGFSMPVPIVICSDSPTKESRAT